MMNSNDNNINVAVYGSLRNGMHNHYFMNNASYIGIEKKNVKFEMLSLGSFPALIPSNNENLITFELYKVNSDDFNKIETLEGYPSFYNRTKIKLNNEDYWVYFIEDFGNIPKIKVDNGDWVSYKIK